MADGSKCLGGGHCHSDSGKTFLFNFCEQELQYLQPILCELIFEVQRKEPMYRFEPTRYDRTTSSTQYGCSYQLLLYQTYSVLVVVRSTVPVPVPYYYYIIRSWLYSQLLAITLLHLLVLDSSTYQQYSIPVHVPYYYYMFQLKQTDSSLFYVHGFISNCLPALQKQYANLGESMGRIQDAVHIIWAVGLHPSGLISFARTQSGCA